MERIGLLLKFRKQKGLVVVEDFVPGIVYDPKYGIPKSRKECTKEHSQYLEHLTVQRLNGNDGGNEDDTCIVIGRFIESDAKRKEKNEGLSD